MDKIRITRSVKTANTIIVSKNGVGLKSFVMHNGQIMSQQMLRTWLIAHNR